MTSTTNVEQDAFRPATVATGKRRGLRRRITATVVALTACLGVVAAVQPAHADGPPRYCTHGGGSTNLYHGLPLYYTPGVVADLYVQRYNGSYWYYTSLSQRAYSTTDGWWMTPTGRYVTAASFNLTPNTGFYRTVSHVYWSGSPSATSYLYSTGYSDNLRGYTTWCQA